MKRFFAALLLFGMVCAMGMTTVGCGKKDEGKKGTTPATTEKKDEKKAEDKKDAKP